MLGMAYPLQMNASTGAIRTGAIITGIRSIGAELLVVISTSIVNSHLCKP